jgi:TolB protein
MADLGTGQAIWQVRTNGSHLHKVYQPKDGTGLDDGPAFTPDGRHIIFTRCCPVSSGYALWSITATGKNLTQVTSEVVPAGLDGPSDNLPQVSPNGREVAYHRNNVEPVLGPEGNRISVAWLDTGVFTDITDPTVLDAQIPNWSPNGYRIVFQSFNYDTGAVDIWRVNRNGSGLTPVTTDGASLNPSYGPGGRIIFGRVTDDGGRDLYIMRSDGTQQRILKATDDLERFPHLIVKLPSPKKSS